MFNKGANKFNSAYKQWKLPLDTDYQLWSKIHSTHTVLIPRLHQLPLDVYAFVDYRECSSSERISVDCGAIPHWAVLRN